MIASLTVPVTNASTVVPASIAAQGLDLAALQPVRDYKARHASTLLTFDAVVDAIAQVEARQAVDAAE